MEDPDMAQDKVEIKVSRGQRAPGLAQNIFSIGTLRKLPSNLTLMRKFMALTRWDDFQKEIQGELGHRVVIVGLANAGKSTLFNTLRGQRLSAVSDQEGTTTELIRGQFGPFTLIDTPGHLPDVQREGVNESSVILMLLDASRGLRREDRDLLHDLRRTNKPLIVALNKVDALKADPDDVAAEIAARLGVEDVIPISGKQGENVAEELVPALLNASPDSALTVGLALPSFRREAADRIVRSAAIVSLAAGLEPIPLIDIPILLGNQIRLVLRLAALYGEPMEAKHTRELATTVIGGLALRYVAEEAAKLVPFGGDVISGAIAAAGTWAIGQVAIEYFESGKQLSRRQLTDAIQRYYRRYREQYLVREIETASTQVAVATPAAREPLALPEARTVTPGIVAPDGRPSTSGTHAEPVGRGA
jgi:GTPase